MYTYTVSETPADNLPKYVNRQIASENCTPTRQSPKNARCVTESFIKKKMYTHEKAYEECTPTY